MRLAPPDKNGGSLAGARRPLSMQECSLQSHFSSWILIGWGLLLLAGCASSPEELPGEQAAWHSIRAGDEQYQRNEFEAARLAYNQAIIAGASRRTRALALLGVARCQTRLGHADQALIHLEGAEVILRATPDFPILQVAFAEAHLELDAMTVALGELEQVHQYLPAGGDREYVSFLLGLVYANQGNLRASRRSLAEAGKGRPTDRRDYWRERITPPAPEIVLPDPPIRKPAPPVAKVRKVESKVMPRSSWGARPTRNATRMSRKIVAITLHHTGDPSPPILTSDRSVKDYLRRQQHFFQKEMTPRPWADLPYHYLIDPRGKVWEGRSMEYQGAHAGNPSLNRGNIGVAVIGNFEISRPTPAQLKTLERFVAQLCRKHGLPVGKVCTHRAKREEGGIGATACPGRHLSAKIPGILRAVGATAFGRRTAAARARSPRR